MNLFIVRKTGAGSQYGLYPLVGKFNFQCEHTVPLFSTVLRKGAKYVIPEGYCEEANIYWNSKVENLLPSTELHTFIAGAPNEFALTGQCDRSDYEYVLDQIKRANRKR